MSRIKSSLALLLCLSLPVTAMAHPGGEAHSFMAGALHPLSGFDHLLAMIAVGLLAGHSGGRLRWWLPASFVIAMAAGAALGAGGIHFAFVESGIALSLVAFGAVLVIKQSLQAVTLIALTAGFALFHGHAHGTEMGANVSALSYGAGFMLMTALLHVFGVMLTTKTSLPLPQATLLKWSGSVVAAVGIVSLGSLLAVPT